MKLGLDVLLGSVFGDGPVFCIWRRLISIFFGAGGGALSPLFAPFKSPVAVAEKIEDWAAALKSCVRASTIQDLLCVSKIYHNEFHYVCYYYAVD